jgi:hypothetical protein
MLWFFLWEKNQIKTFDLLRKKIRSSTDIMTRQKDLQLGYKFFRYVLHTYQIAMSPAQTNPNDQTMMNMNFGILRDAPLHHGTPINPMPRDSPSQDRRAGQAFLNAVNERLALLAAREQAVRQWEEAQLATAQLSGTQTTEAQMAEAEERISAAIRQALEELEELEELGELGPKKT